MGTGQDEHVPDEVERLRLERDALQDEVASLRARRRVIAGARSVARVLAVVLACLSVAALAVAVWTDRTVLSTDGWVGAVGPLGTEPAVTAALRPRVTDAAVSAVPIEEAVADALPGERDVLAAPLTTAIRSFVDDRVGAFLSSDAFGVLWVDMNAVAHARALGVLRGEGDVVQVTGDAVTLNLLPVVNAVLFEVDESAGGLLGRDVTLPTVSGGELPDAARERLGAALGVDLPDDFGEIPVYGADELVVAQQALRLFDQLLVVLAVATPLLIVAALWLSRHRRTTVVQLAVGSALALVVVRRAAAWLQDAVVALAPTPEGRSAARVVTDQVLDGLLDLTAVLVAVAVAVVVLALVSGPSRGAVALRRGAVDLGRATSGAGGRVAATAGVAAWATAHRQALQVGGALIVGVALFTVDLGWGLMLALLAVLAAWEIALWRLAGEGSPSTAAPR